MGVENPGDRSGNWKSSQSIHKNIPFTNTVSILAGTALTSPDAAQQEFMGRPEERWKRLLVFSMAPHYHKILSTPLVLQWLPPLLLYGATEDPPPWPPTNACASCCSFLHSH